MVNNISLAHRSRVGRGGVHSIIQADAASRRGLIQALDCMKKVTLAIKNHENILQETVEVIADDPTLELLQEFLFRVDRVDNTSLLERGMPSPSRIQWNRDRGWIVTCEKYTNAELHELLHVLRPLILKKEPYSFEKTSSVVSRLVNNEKINKWIKAARKIYDNGELSSYMQFSVNGQAIFHDSFLSLWLNSEQYHNDSEKKETWAKIESALKAENTRGLVMGQLQGKVKAIHRLAYLCNLIVANEDAV